MMNTSLNVVVVLLLFVPKRLKGHVLVLVGDWERRILVVGKVRIVIRDFDVMHGKGLIRYQVLDIIKSFSKAKVK